MARQIPDKVRRIFTDTIWSVLGLVLMNVAAQLVVYPFWNRVLGTEAYGNVVYVMAVMNIFAISFGTGINYTRMRKSADEETKNSPYLILLLIGTAVSLASTAILFTVGLLKLGLPEFLLLLALTAATTWRYYADVEFRLHVNFKGYFLYYVIIGLGYLLGVLLFRATGLWPLALLPGEIAGLLFVLLRGSIFRGDKTRAELPADIVKLSSLLIGTTILSQLIFNGDRLVLRLCVGGTAVSIFYIASLFGKTMTLISTPLNGVLIGHLAKYDGKLTKKLMNTASLLAIGASVIATLICFAASLIFLPILYPNEFGEVRRCLLVANASQVIYFVGNVLVASVLLRFTPARNQLIVNVTHGVLFAAVCIPAAIFTGLDGFCVALLCVNALRLALCLFLGYLNVYERKKK